MPWTGIMVSDSAHIEMVQGPPRHSAYSVLYLGAVKLSKLSAHIGLPELKLLQDLRHRRI